MRTGILGGTFNPPHLGHLHAAELAHDALRLDRVLFIPTNLPPHKALPGKHGLAEARCEMVRRLTGGQAVGAAGYARDRPRRRELHGGHAARAARARRDQPLSDHRNGYAALVRPKLARAGRDRASGDARRVRTGKRGLGRAARKGGAAARNAGREDRTRPGRQPSRSPRPSCGRAAICTASLRLRSRIISSGSTFTGFRATEKRGA